MPGYVYRGTQPLKPEDVIPAKKTRVRAPRAPFNPELCGTMDGHRQHRRHSQKQCRQCAAVDNQRRRERQATKQQ